MTDTNNEISLARDVFERFGEAYMRGHDGYMLQARKNEDYYLGGGRQWDPQVRKELEDDGRPCYEVNTVMPSVNSAVGYQISNRVDASFVPRGGEADEKGAKLMSKVIRQILDNERWQDKETDIFLDGMIQQRGYLDVRMSYEMSDLGLPALRVPDPLDVVPDPDAKDYDVDTWADIHEARWLTAAQIEQSYGADAAQEVINRSSVYAGADDQFGIEFGLQRSGFGERMPGFYGLSRGWMGNVGAWRRYRLIERQTNEYVMSLVARWPTGDLRVVEGLPREHIGWLLDHGIPVFKKRMRRVRWITAAPEVVLHNDVSPYDHFTIQPFFPYFRRGRTVGMVDNQTSVQDMLNKFLSQYGHVVNGSANGGWQGEAGVLRNMTDEAFTRDGAQTGIVLLREPGSKPFEKIQPNQIPTGLDRMIEFAHQNARVVSGMDERLSNMGQKELSGVAVKGLMFADQQKLAICLANLKKTRAGVVMRVLECTQKFMGAERVLRIAEEDAYGVMKYVPHVLNARQDDGSILNDLTAGQYDLVLDERPMTVTFDNSDFDQIMAMRKEGIRISDARVIRASNLTDKSAIAEEMAKQTDQPDPLTEADTQLKMAQAKAIAQQGVAKAIEAQFSAIKTAREIVLTPQTAAIADALLRSGGFIDADAAPIVPTPPPGTEPVPPDGPENTHPLFPPNPQVGLDTGMTETT